MPNHSETKRLPYTAQQMYDLVADVGAYPKFLPWNAAARIRTRKPGPDGSEVMEADLVISFKVFRERFTSRVMLWPGPRKIDTELRWTSTSISNSATPSCKGSSGWSSTTRCSASSALSNAVPRNFTGQHRFDATESGHSRVRLGNVLS